MAIVGSDLAVQWSTRYETLWLTEYNSSIAVDGATLAQLAMELPLGDNQGNTVQLDWLGAAPQMREWVDEKRALGLNKNSWSVVVKRYEASIEIDLDALRDARGNVYEPRIREMASNASRLRYNLISGLISGGAAALCYDGQYFFDTDHSEGDSGNQSNKLSGTGVTQAAIETDFYAAKSKLMGFVDDKAVPMQPTNFRPLVWIPNDPVMEQRFRTLQAASLIANTSNILANSFDLVVDPLLTDTNDWFMFRVDRPLKPFIYVDRETPHYEDDFGSGNEAVFKRRKGMASAVGRGVATYGMWQTAVQVTQ
jgi:phage major head subunit gpT-like protein